MSVSDRLPSAIKIMLILLLKRMLGDEAYQTFASDSFDDSS